MLRRSLNDIASGLAAHVRKNLAGVERGAVPVRLVEDTVGPLRLIDEGAVIGIFGNDNYIAEVKARREVELTRKRLRELGAEEAGFGLSQDGYTWALLVRCDDRRYRTETGKALQRELLKMALEEAVSRAWRDACDALPTLNV
ncbi:MAG TPA: hypothetical protein VKA46_05005 [Gemmataceae bacterium]|nr:hypothetical protein [Gemmataceae bacterium]